MTTTKKKLKIFVLLAAISILLSGCFKLPSEQVSKNGQNLSGKTVISIKDFVFEPAELTIKAGDSVTWVNNSPSIHNVMANNVFSSGDLKSGESFSYKFDKTGVYDYICFIHPAMNGKIIVTQ